MKLWMLNAALWAYILSSSYHSPVLIDSPVVCRADLDGWTCATANTRLGAEIQLETGIYIHHAPRPESVIEVWRIGAI